jgi:hypothetical protein
MGRVAAQETVAPQDPEIAGPGDRRDGRFRNLVFVRLPAFAVPIETIEQAIKVVFAKSQEIEADTIFPQTRKFRGEHRVVPPGIQRDLVVGDPEGPRLGAGQMPEPDHRDFGKPEALGCEQTPVPGDQHAALIDKARHVEAEFRDRACDLRDLGFGMRAGVRDVGQKPVDRPTLDAIRQPGRHDRGQIRLFGVVTTAPAGYQDWLPDAGRKKSRQFKALSRHATGCCW